MRDNFKRHYEVRDKVMNAAKIPPISWGWDHGEFDN